MKIIHFTLGRVNPKSLNGINKVVEGLCSSSNSLKNIDASVISLKPNLTSKSKIYGRKGFEVLAFKKIKDIINHIKTNKDNIDLIHFHNTWSYQNVLISFYLKSYKINYVVSPHASLFRDRVKASNFIIKLLFQKFIQKRHLDNALIVFATSKEEFTAIRDYTSNLNIILTENGINLDVKKLKNKIQSNKIKLVTVSRLSIEKNIISLIEAINYLDSQYVECLEINIIGDINNGYAEKCIDLVTEYGLQNVVVFRGVLVNQEKNEFLNQMDAYIQTSYSEGGLSIAIREAMLLGLPIIATRTCNVAYYYRLPFLIMTEPIDIDISNNLKMYIDNYEYYKEMKIDIIQYALDNFNWDIISKNMINYFYEYSKVLDEKN